MITKNTLVKTNKEYNFDMALLSDIHADKNTDYSVLDKMISEIDKRYPQYIIFLGDALNDGTDIESAKRVSDYLYKMGKLAPVIMILGNHDKVTKKGDRWFFIRNDEDMKKFNDIVSLYKSIPNVNYLSNNSKTIDGIKFYGMDPDISFYSDDLSENKKFQILYEPIDSYFLRREYNIILTHSPVLVMDNGIINVMPIYINSDLILAGHMHNGLLPVYMEWMIPNNKGLIGKRNKRPYLFPDISKGSIKFSNNITGIIANPICTFSSDKGNACKFEKLYPVPYQNVKVRKLIK